MSLISWTSFIHNLSCLDNGWEVEMMLFVKLVRWGECENL